MHAAFPVKPMQHGARVNDTSAPRLEEPIESEHCLEPQWLHASLGSP